MGRILAVDYGEKRIGIANTDVLQYFAQPLKVIPNNGFEGIVTELENIVREQNAVLVLVGIPYAIEGGNTPKTEETLAFMQKLSGRMSIPVQGWDERYSTSEAVEELIKLGYDWKQRRSTQDAMAACMILKNYLESK